MKRLSQHWSPKRCNHTGVSTSFLQMQVIVLDFCHELVFTTIDRLELLQASPRFLTYRHQSGRK